jgi:hypothetical protein
MKDFLLAWVKPLAKFATKAMSSVMAFFLGRGYERAKQRKRENKALRDNVVPDHVIADRLRKRADRKD